MPASIYFDYAAAAPMSDTVRQAMEPYVQTQFYNPSATYLPARRVKQALDDARHTVAETIGARGPEITFTAGGTEANNLALNGVMAQFPGSRLVVSAIEHESVLEPAARYGAKLAPVGPDGILVVDELMRCVDDQTMLVSVMYANNEVGSVQPIRQIAQRIAEVRTQRRQVGNTLPLYLHTDAAQAANYLDLHVARLGVDLMTLNGGKIYGPKQSGALYVRGGLVLQPQILGGGQEHGLRSGTENVAASIGFATALQATQQIRRDETARLQKLQNTFYRSVLEKGLAVVVNGSRLKRLPNNLHITIPGNDNERLLLQLEEAGILAAAGSACSASNETPSHVLRAMGLADEAIRSSLRFTMGRGTSQADIDALLVTLAQLVA